MTFLKVGGHDRRSARRLGVRVLFIALACVLVLSGTALRFGASAQKVGQDAAKQSGATGKTSPFTRTRSASKPGGSKEIAVAGERQPLVLGCTNATTTLTIPQTVNGTLASTDCQNPIDNSFYDAYSFTGTAGQQVTINMTSTTFDTYLYLMVPGETTLRNLSDPNPTIQDDDGGGGTNSRLPSNQPLAQAPPFSGTLPTTGTYTIIANAFCPPDGSNTQCNAVNDNGKGAYTLSLSLTASCTPTVTPISIVGGTGSANGSLSTTDCTLNDGSFYDVYTFNGTAGQQIAIQMNASFDSFLFLVGPDGDELARDDNGSGGTNARIPAIVPGFGTAPSARLPQTGVYRIIANSAASGVTGSYTLLLSVDTASCPSTAITVGQTVNGALASGDCRLPADSSFIDVYTFSGAVGQTISVTMSSTDFDPYLFILDKDGKKLDEDDNGGGGTSAHLPSGKNAFSGVLPATGTYTIYANSALTGKTGNYTLTLTGSGGSGCATTIFPNVIPFTSASGTGRFTVFPASAQCNTWTAATTATWIHITSPTNGTGTGRVRFSVDANSGATTRTGTITVGTSTLSVTQTAAATTPTVQFSNTNYAAIENDPSKSVQITVTRTGDTAGAAKVEYSTIDDPAAIPCSTANGTAYARCDYVTTIDTLTFNAGETTKTFTIPLIDDVHVEGNETFRVQLANPQGATLGTPSQATITIVDNDTTAATTNPIHSQTGQPAFFVRMQYLDFLSREPEPAEPWSAIYNPCPNQDNFDPASPSANCDRISVSSAFFLSQEFQVKGFFVFLYYKVSFGSASNPNYYPNYDEIVPDMRRITGATTEERIDKTFNFAEDWVTRPAFITRYAAMTNAQFVDTLLANVGATLTTADSVSGETRNSLVAKLDAGTKTRADVLRNIVESREVNNLQLNPAFVAMQYFGYLRRTPDIGGYQAWLAVIGPPRNANPREMVNGFVNSAEYYLRFGPNVRQ
jgi:hypothetical protein